MNGLEFEILKTQLAEVYAEWLRAAKAPNERAAEVERLLDYASEDCSDEQWMALVVILTEQRVRVMRERWAVLMALPVIWPLQTNGNN